LTAGIFFGTNFSIEPINTLFFGAVAIGCANAFLFFFNTATTIGTVV
jgi:hypothetical protein